MNFGFLRLPLLTVFFPSLLLPKSSALVQSGKRECSAFSKNCQEQGALFFEKFFIFFSRLFGAARRGIGGAAEPLAGPEGAGNGAEAQPRKARPPLAGGAAKEM